MLTSKRSNLVPPNVVFDGRTDMAGWHKVLVLHAGDGWSDNIVLDCWGSNMEDEMVVVLSSVVGCEPKSASALPSLRLLPVLLLCALLFIKCCWRHSAIDAKLHGID